MNIKRSQLVTKGYLPKIKAEIERLRELESKATPSPLLLEHRKFPGSSGIIIANCDYCEEEPFVVAEMNSGMDNWPDDRRLLVESRNAIPKMIAAMGILIGALETLKVAVNDKVSDPGAVNFIDTNLAKAAEILGGKNGT